VKQKRLVDQAVARLMRIHDEKNQGHLLLEQGAPATGIN
jgi:hypothetical protein